MTSRYMSGINRQVCVLAEHAASHHTAEDMAAAVRVLTTMTAPEHMEAHSRAMTTDQHGNPVMDTPEQREAQARWSRAQTVDDELSDLLRALVQASHAPNTD